MGQELLVYSQWDQPLESILGKGMGHQQITDLGTGLQ